MRFLVDMPLSPRLAAWLREAGHDALHAVNLGMDRASDEEVLTRASQEDRVVVTADLDFPHLLALSGARRPGILLLRGGNYSEAQAKELVGRVLAQVPAVELSNSIVVVDHARTRRVRLPVRGDEPMSL